MAPPSALALDPLALYSTSQFQHFQPTARMTGFDAAFFYAGQEPYYPTGKAKEMVMTDVLQTEYAATTCKWFFEIKTGKLLGMECWLLPDTDPCELTFTDYQPRDGVHRTEIDDERVGRRLLRWRRQDADRPRRRTPRHFGKPASPRPFGARKA